MRASLWAEAGCDFGDEPHVVQLYRTASFMQKSVAAWIAPALERGGGACVLSTAGNAARVRAQLRADGVDPVPHERDGRLLFVDAEDMIARVMVDGAPDPERFTGAVGGIVQSLKATCGPDAEIRAWGELVNILWRRGEPHAAERLEELWSRFLASERIRLLCAYGVADAGESEYDALRHAVSRTHDRVTSEGVAQPSD